MSWFNGPNSVAASEGVSALCECFAVKCGSLYLHSLPLDQLFEAHRPKVKHVVTVNAEIFVLAHEDQKLAGILSKSINTIDGRVLQTLCRMLYLSTRIVRQNGANFVFDLAEYCRQHSERLLLLGSSEQVNAKAAERLRDLFPGVQVSGYSPPFGDYPFAPDWNENILRQISAFRPHHVVVCFGPKKQEYWIHENASALTELGVGCAYGLGGTIDFLAGAKPRAPKWIEFIGAEWLFRLACEPRARFGRTMMMFKMPYYVAKTTREVSPLNGDSVGTVAML